MAEFKLTDEQLAELAPPEGAPFRLGGVREFTTPHPYMIGSKHIEVASDRHGGMLGESAIEDAETYGYCCQMPLASGGKCGLKMSEHENHKALVVVLPDTAPKDLNKVEGLLDYLKGVKDKAESFGVTTFMFPKEKQL